MVTACEYSTLSAWLLSYNPYLVEKSLKSARRSHTRRPVRDALLEYAGPMPFLVVPMLPKEVMTNTCLLSGAVKRPPALFAFLILTSFLPVLVSQFPVNHRQPGGNRTLWRDGKQTKQ